MIGVGLTRIFRDTRSFLEERLSEPEAPSTLFVRFVTPLVLIRSVAVLLRGLLIGDPAAGIVLALGNFVLQMGVWLAISFALPVLVKQFGSRMDDQGGFAVMSYASVPLWLAGALYIVPEEPPFTFFWSRSLVAACAGFGVYVLYRGFQVLEIRRKSILVPAVVVGYSITYLFLFGLVGLSSTILLLIVRAS
ncbi:MAG: YIP1 family protein [Myxococcota bacterium]